MTKRWLLPLLTVFCTIAPGVQAQVRESEFPRDLHGLWWEPGESGWAIAMFDHQAAMSSVHLVYDISGMPTWVVSPRLECFREQPPHLAVTCGGPMYRVKGSWFGAPSYRASDVVVSTVGEWSGLFTVPLFGSPGPDLRRALYFSYSIDSVRVISSGARSLEIQPIDPKADFLWRDGRYSGLWNNPNELGWGVGVFVQNSTIFATLLVHGQDMQPRWYVISGEEKERYEERPDRIFEGTVYETRGYPFERGLPGAAEVHVVGSASLHFGANVGDPAVLSYSINGVQVTKTVQRQY